MENDNLPDKQIVPTSAQPNDDSQEEFNTPTSDESEDEEEVVPAEVAEVLEELPPKKRQMISSMVLSMERMSSSGSSALVKKVTSEHIDKTLNNLDKENERDFQKSQSNEITKRLGMGAILILVLMVFGYAALTKDEDLAEKVMIAGISGLGGFGIGIAWSKKN